MLAVLAFLLANSLYLTWARFGDRVGLDEPHLPATYQAMLLIHILAGFLAVLPAAGFAIARVRTLESRPGAAAPAVLLAGCSILLLLTGCFLLSAASVRANRTAFSAPQAAAAVAVAALFAALWRIHSPRPGRALAWCAGIAAMTAAMIAVHIIEGLDHRYPEGIPPSRRHSLAGAMRDRCAGEPDPGSPFYPSPATMSSGGGMPGRIFASGFLRDPAGFHAQTAASGFAADHPQGAEGCAGCHRDLAEQRAASAHRYASFNNPFYRRSIEVTRDTAGRQASHWCASCHDPALLFEGGMTEEIDPLSPWAQAGLTCIACHAIDRIHSETGSGHHNLGAKAASPYLFSESKAGMGRFLHDFILKVKPLAHNSEMMKPFFRESIYCGTCHKVGTRRLGS